MRLAATATRARHSLSEPRRARSAPLRGVPARRRRAPRKRAAPCLRAGARSFLHILVDSGDGRLESAGILSEGRPASPLRRAAAARSSRTRAREADREAEAVRGMRLSACARSPASRRARARRRQAGARVDHGDLTQAAQARAGACRRVQARAGACRRVQAGARAGARPARSVRTSSEITTADATCAARRRPRTLT